MSQRLGLLSLLGGLGIFGLNALVWTALLVLVISNPLSARGQDGSLVFTAVGVLFMLSALGHVAGVGLGIAALVRREPRPVVGVLGLLLNAGLLLGVAGLLVLSFLGASV